MQLSSQVVSFLPKASYVFTQCKLCSNKIYAEFVCRVATMGKNMAICALLKRGEGAYELTKMGVLSSARGLKVGEIFLQHVI